MKLECQECGAVGRYAVSNETECRNCGGSDLDLAPGQAPVPATKLGNMDREDYEQVRSEFRRLAEVVR